MQTAINKKDLYKNLRHLREAGIFLLLLHSYLFCYGAFRSWGFSTPFTDRFLIGLGHTPLFKSFQPARLLALALFLASASTFRQRPPQKKQPRIPLRYSLAGLACYFGAQLVFYFSFGPYFTAILYCAFTFLGYGLLWHAASILIPMYWPDTASDVFNAQNETFPQEQQLLQNEDSINFPTEFKLEGRKLRGWINIDPYRGLLVMGSPGSGKSWFIIRNIIRQHLEKHFAMVVYDFKYDDLSKLTYNYFLKCRATYPVKPEFYLINFDDLPHSHRCNPIHPSILYDMADAADAARTILLGLNRDWIGHQGDFWIESSVSFLTALIWYLKKFAGGKYCTLPHVIELLQVDYPRLFSILRCEPEIENYINPLLNAYLNHVKETLDNQASSLKIAINRLSIPSLYYVLSGDDFSLDIGNPRAPKILCLGNSPRRSGVYGAVISLYLTTIYRLDNQEERQKSSHVYDEMSTIYPYKLHEVLATGRSNKIALTLCVQNIDQLKLGYGATEADVIANLPGSVISGQNTGDTAKALSERIGRIVQPRQSTHTNSKEDSHTESTQLEFAVPISRIAALSPGEFVGLVADNPGHPVTNKAFHARILLDQKKLEAEEHAFHPLPVVSKVSKEDIAQNFTRIRQEIADLVTDELHRMQQKPGLKALIIRPPKP